MTASAPHAATFSACRRAPMDGMTTTPASFSSAISSRDGASANEATRTPSSMITRTRSRASPASARRLTPKGASVRDFTSRTADLSWSRVMVAEARMPSAPGVRRRRHQAGARDPAHAGLHERVADADQLGERRLDRVASLIRACTSRSRSPFGSMTSRISRSSSAVGSRVCGTSPVRQRQREARRRAHLVDGDPGVHGREPHRAVRRLEVEDAEVGHDARDAVVAGRRRSRPRPRCRTRPR